MGVIASKAIKPFKNWNAINRAIIQTEKDTLNPRAATKFQPKTESHSTSIINEKNIKLIEEIRKFEITSTEVIEGKRVNTRSSRPLPKRQLPYDLDIADEKQIEPIIIPEGKISIALLIEMLKKYREDISIEDLAEAYKLPPEKVYNILRFNRLFVLNPPGEKLRLLIGDELTDDVTADKEPKPHAATRMLYPEAYGKNNASE